MIKKSILVMLLAVSITSMGFADTKEIKKVVIAEGSGINSDYDASTGILTWSQGASGYLMDGDFNQYVANDIQVSGQFSSPTDSSAGGQAQAAFTLDFVTLTFNSIDFSSLTGGGEGTATLTLSSYNGNKYWEGETDADLLHGQALVNVDAVFNLEGLWGSQYGFVWDGANGVSCLDAMILLPNGTNFQSYQSDYSSDNNGIMLYADETVYSVPEPCTLGLLAIGGIGFILRKRPQA